MTFRCSFCYLAMLPLCSVLQVAFCWGQQELLVLQNMPVNSDQRCVGIAAVAEALLESKETAASEDGSTVNVLAKAIFKSLSSDRAFRFPAYVELNGKRVAISDRVAINAMSSLVADFYKQETKRISRSAEGVQNLHAARYSVLQSKQELLRTLEADDDQTELFCCFGIRQFPDKTYKETHHAVLLRKLPEGSVVVFDPNDPGSPIECQFRESEGELTAEWTCKYRETGLVTKQRYQLVPKSTFFRTARGE